MFEVDFRAFRVSIVTKLDWLGTVVSNLSGTSTILEILNLSDHGSVGVLIVSCVNNMVCKGVMQAPCVR